MVTGANGQMGNELQVLAPDFTDYRFLFVTKEDLNIADTAATEKYFSNDKSYIIQTEDNYLLGLLNSKIIWQLIIGMCPYVRGGFYEARAQYIETLPIPNATTEQRAEIATLAETCQTAAQARLAAQVAFIRRIPDLAGTNQLKLNTKLQQWWLLDFASFRAEILKCFKAEIPLKDRNDWHDLFNQQQTLINTYSQQIQLAEQQLNAAVYALFALNAGEIALIEAL